MMNFSNDSLNYVDEPSINETEWLDDPDEDSAFLQLALVLSLCLIAFTILSNLLVVIAIVKFSSLRTITNYYVLSLAMADIGVGVLVMPLGALHALMDEHDGTTFVLCQVYLTSDILFCTSSIWHLAAIAVARHRAICRPIAFATENKQRRTAVVILLVWLLCIALTVPLLMVNELKHITDEDEHTDETFECGIYNVAYSRIWTLVGFVVPLIIILVCYLRIYLSWGKKSRAVRDLVRRSISEEKAKTLKTRENKVTTIMLIVIVVFMACWLPIKIFDFVVTFCTEPSCGLSRNLLSFMFLIAYGNSALNPIIYTVFNEDFRKSFLKLLCCKCNETQVNRNRPTITLSSRPEKSTAI
ncbi:putative G-protein coupled receptor No18 [Halotydeus destructor]|nr:putative G-protein coupled receptor No18 [Halotydeus destructor]